MRDGMTNSESSGWIVQITIPAELEEAGPDSPWRSPGMRGIGAPSFKYFNVAIPASDKAIEATAKFISKAIATIDGEISVTRKLSAGEIAALSLAAGEVKPA